MAWGSPKVLAELLVGIAVPHRLRRHRKARRRCRCSTSTCSASAPSPRASRRACSTSHRPRRPAVHADHLAAGHLAAAARLQLRIDAALGRHLHAAADARRAARRPRRRHPVRSLRLAHLRRRRHAARRGDLPRADDAATPISPIRCSPCCSSSTASARACSCAPNAHADHERGARRASAARPRACAPPR